MPQVNELIELYELIELNKQFFIDTIEEFITNVNTCISSRDLSSLNSLYQRIYTLDEFSKKPFLCSSQAFRIQAIKNALTLEADHGTELFWNDVKDSEELLEKYNKTIFMLRRLNSDLPESYKQEALVFLRNITPFFISSVFRDETVIIGNEDSIYMDLALDGINCHSFKRAATLLKLIHDQNDEIKNLIKDIEAL